MTKLTRTELLTLAKLGAAARLAEIEVERARMVKILNTHTAARQKRRAAHHRAKLGKKTKPVTALRTKPHWTQRPENKARLRRMLEKATEARRKNSGGKP